jgi:hypothetical protein
MAQARKFNSVKAAQDWLVARGFAATATQHIWKNGSRMAAINAELGGVMPKFQVAMGDSKTDSYWQRAAVVAARHAAGVLSDAGRVIQGQHGSVRTLLAGPNDAYCSQKSGGHLGNGG